MSRVSRKSVRARGRAGFTIVELVIAVMILGVGILGLASTATVMSQMVFGGAQRTLAAHAAQSRFEQLRSVSCVSLVGGSVTTRGIVESWTVTALPKARDVSVTITYPGRRGSRTRVFRSLVPCE